MSSKKVLITDIEWDADPEDIDSLPTSATIENPTQEQVADAYGYGDSIADWLSDNFGFCVLGFSTDVAEA